MKAALRKYGDPRIASDTIADLKIAYWARLVQNKQGAAHSPQVMLNNIKAALANQKTLVQELYSPAEIGQMRRLQNALERIVYKDPNPSGSGYMIAALVKQFFGKIMEAFGAKGVLARTALEWTGLPSAHSRALVNRAISKDSSFVPRNWAPVVNPVASTYGREGPD